MSPVQAQVFGNEQLTNFGQAVGYGEAGLPEIIGRIIKAVLSLLGLIAVIIIIIGGFIWMTSGGVSEKVEKAKKIISSGLIGLLIIVFAYAIVSFIMSRLTGITGPVADGQGCTPGLCCGFGVRCDTEGNCAIPDPSCSPPPDAFKIKKIETTHGGLEQNYHQDVYLCSAVQPKFNHSVDGLIIEALEIAGDLRIETGASPVSGSWQTRNNIIIFKHPDLFDPNTSYEAYFPKAISDTQGEFLQVCLAAGDCLDAGSYFLWNFMTGETLDTVPPEIVATYPIFDQSDPDYPDQNVSRKPSVEVSFSEPIDMTTVADENNYPIETNIGLARLDGQGGAIVEALAKEIFEVQAISDGFRISLRDENLLQAFTWYRIHVGNIEDLCMNQMDGPLEWEFQTNDQVPGISFWHPTGTLVCPDTDISVTFGTQMYDNLVRFEISGGGDNFDFEMRPSEFDPPYEK
ncbi:Ig-like domain-containing protein, partial [Patescibacteria group bacterium]|nr:Ig-like domain-containing protein [Patescibacteria group bacterium]